MAKAGIQGAVHRDEDHIHRLCIKVYRFLASYCVRSNTNRWGNIYEQGYKKQKEGAKVDKRKPLW